jgi:hypothetical protein
MKKSFLVVAVALMLFVIAISAVSFASEYRNNAGQVATASSIQQSTGSNTNGYGCYGRGKRVQSWADALGISTDEFISLRSSGKTIAEIAAEKGLKIEDVVKKVLQSDADYLNQLVSKGQLTRERADEILKLKEQRLLERANAAPGAGSCSGRGCGGAGQGCGAGRGNGSNCCGGFGGNPGTSNI